MRMTCHQCGSQVDEAVRLDMEEVEYTFDPTKIVPPALFWLKPCGHVGPFTVANESPTWPIK